ncbi:GID complex subunit containing RING finger motif [Vermiconidia calcicola]|uniref:GID complex subunit containing RING finger motif n=1 Tax=Vermiconidia calcicola TaxID=1690605 RepID=A0ACC3NFT8_9PEZI|nr:GID complex subunit containing RING finger motif [Vermiconidia calcicola]
MAEYTSTKLDPDSHLLLDQPLLRLPHELLRKNLKSAQRQIEMTNKSVTSAVQASNNHSPADTLASLDATLAKAQNLTRKLEALQSEEKALHKQQKARIQHLEELHEIPSLSDVKYDNWSHARLDRLLVDYLLRQGYTQSAKELAQEKGVEDLVDIGVFEECGRIEKSLQEGKTQECLTWCGENKQALKKIDNNLELELRLQQFIELARSGEMKQRLEAMIYARKHLAGGQDPKFALQAAGLLAQPPDTPVEPYRTMYSHGRYEDLARQFLKTHHELLTLPPQPLLHIALSAGLSALKTPACHSVHALQPSTLTGAPVCPICSTELNELARNVPYAHHTKSYMEDDPVVLPNGRVFGRERLKMLNEKVGTKKGKLRDPTETSGTEWGEWEIKKVFIS